MRTVLAVIEHGRRVVGGEQAAGQRGERNFAYGIICPLDVFLAPGSQLWGIGHEGAQLLDERRPFGLAWRELSPVNCDKAPGYGPGGLYMRYGAPLAS